jgi:hypothetical protein
MSDANLPAGRCPLTRQAASANRLLITVSCSSIGKNRLYRPELLSPPFRLRSPGTRVASEREMGQARSSRGGHALKQRSAGHAPFRAGGGATSRTAGRSRLPGAEDAIEGADP